MLELITLPFHSPFQSILLPANLERLPHHLRK